MDIKSVGLGLAVALALLFTLALGWIASASTIAQECRKLGSFYVSNTVFECRLK